MPRGGGAFAAAIAFSSFRCTFFAFAPASNSANDGSPPDDGGGASLILACGAAGTAPCCCATGEVDEAREADERGGDARVGAREARAAGPVGADACNGGRCWVDASDGSRAAPSMLPPAEDIEDFAAARPARAAAAVAPEVDVAARPSIATAPSPCPSEGDVLVGWWWCPPCCSADPLAAEA